LFVNIFSPLPGWRRAVGVGVVYSLTALNIGAIEYFSGIKYSLPSESKRILVRLSVPMNDTFAKLPLRSITCSLNMQSLSHIERDVSVSFDLIVKVAMLCVFYVFCNFQ
jgi:hypothetical protein